MWKTNCILLSLGIFQCVLNATAIILTNEFAVHIPEGDEVASKTAKTYGFINKGQIGSLEGYYLFEHHNIMKRSNTPSLIHSELLRNDTSVKWCEQQQVKRRVKRSASTREVNFRDPLFVEQWFIYSVSGFDMNVVPVWKEGITGKGVVVTILDDGIQYNHPDLAQNYDKEASTDINDADDDPTPKDDDNNKHGTRCAGEVAAVANNEFCGVGIAYNASIGGVRMLDGSVTDSVEATALSLRPDHIDIYSASWGPEDNGKAVDGPGKLAEVAFENGIKKGRQGLGSIFVWASGNGGNHFDNCNCDGYTNSIYTISISSASQSNAMPWYLEQCSSTLASTYSSGAEHDGKIVTVDVDTSFQSQIQSFSSTTPDITKMCTKSHTGTSASAPIAAGICALALEANPLLTWRDLQHIIVRTSRYVPLDSESGWITNGVGLKVSTKFGFGLMDAHGMVKLARTWKTVSKQQTCTQLIEHTNRDIPEEVNVPLEVSVNTTACENEKNQIKYLEHVQVVITLEYKPRGNLHIILISPQNTQSNVLLPRPKDNIHGSFDNWPFMSVQFWGENPKGIWKLVIKNNGNLKADFPGKLESWSLVLYGTAYPPIPDSRNEPFHILKKYAENNKCFDKKEFQVTISGNSECTPKCPLGMYGDLSDHTCHECDKSCASCFGPSYKNCLSCTKYFLLNNICIKSCPDGFYSDHEARMCLPCKPSCETCQSSKICSTCKVGFYYFANKCLSICPLETFTYLQTCSKCHPTCETCFGPHASNCVTCPVSYVIHKNTCLKSCPNHFFATNELSCDRCHHSCKLCSDFNTCSECNQNWNQISIDSCSFESKCPSTGWFNPQLVSCDNCFSNCEECSLPNIHNCATCNAGYKWHEGNCTTICPEGYFVLQDECSLCDDLCLKCESKNKCLLCKNGFLLYFGKCYPSCPLGWYDGGRRKCEMCHPNCLHCIGGTESSCVSCPLGFYHAENKCLSKCPDRFFSIENDCMPCHSTCTTCTDFGPAHCTSCNHNTSFSKGYCIPCLIGEFYNKNIKKCERCHSSCGRCFGKDKGNCLSCIAPLRLDEVQHLCLPCCSESQKKIFECCNCSKHLDVCIVADYPRSITVNLSTESNGKIVIPLKHVIPIVIAICASVVFVYVILFGLLHANSMGVFSFKFKGPKYERVPNMSAKFDADMEKVSLTQDLDDEDEIYEKV